MWNIKTVKNLSRLQKKMILESLKLLKIEGEIIYSTCTHAPEENEKIIDFALETFKDKIQIQKITLPIKTRPGITFWNEKKYSQEIKKTCRVYPQDNDTEGFFIAKIKKIKDTEMEGSK